MVSKTVDNAVSNLVNAPAKGKRIDSQVPLILASPDFYLITCIGQVAITGEPAAGIVDNDPKDEILYFALGTDTAGSVRLRARIDFRIR